MKKSCLHFAFLCLPATLLFSCGESKNEKEDTELPPAEHTDLSDEMEDMPVQVNNTTADSRIIFTFNEVGDAGDTAAAMISGYIDAGNAPVEPNKMQLLLHTKPLQEAQSAEHDYTMKVEADGRVPGIWVAENSDCRFALVIAKDTIRFSAPVGTAMYRFKVQFKRKS